MSKEIEISDEEITELETNSSSIDMKGEVCPYPQIIAREELKKIEPGGFVII